MKIKILFPTDFFNSRQVDDGYQNEYDQVVKIPEFEVVLYQYDSFIRGEKLNLYPPTLEPGPCIYRGWMLKPDQYLQLYHSLLKKDVLLINTPEQYQLCHCFPNAYPYLRHITPGIKVFHDPQMIDWADVKKSFHHFFIKDFVKSVKGTKFPAYFDATYSDQELDQYIAQFITLRGDLFTGGIVIKEYLDLAKYDQTTNEYRAFIMQGEIISVSKNSEQSSAQRDIPLELVRKAAILESNFYTVDFAELVDGRFVLIETGDGQVSGLSPDQYIFKFYDEIRRVYKFKYI